MNAKKIKFYTYLIISLVLFGGILTFSSNYFTSSNEYMEDQVEFSGTISPDAPPVDSIEYYGRQLDLSVPDFWPGEHAALESRDLNFTRLESRVVSQEPHALINTTSSANVNITHVQFSPVDWNGSPMVIDGDLYEPVAAYPNDSIPGVLYLHGLFGQKGQGSGAGKAIAAKGGVALSISLPGHGLSDGPPLLPEVIFNYSSSSLAGRKSPIFYLGLLAGLGGLKVLESIPSVNASNLAIIGGSWGGLHAQGISGVEHAINNNSRVKLTVIIVASGDILTSASEKSITNIMRPPSLNPFNPGDHEFDLVQDWDPMIYAAQVQNIHYVIGTNDDFFTLNSVKKTLEVVKLHQPNGTLGYTIVPSDHHDIGPERNIMYPLLRNYTWKENKSFPVVQATIVKEQTAWDQRIRASFNIILTGNDTVEDIDYVSIGYKHFYFGAEWQEIKVQPLPGVFSEKNYSLEKLLPGPLIDCNTDVVISVIMKDGIMISAFPASFYSRTPWTFILIPSIIFGLALLAISWFLRIRKKLKGQDGKGEKAGTRKKLDLKEATDRFVQWIKTMDKQEKILLLRLGVLAGCEATVMWAFTMDWLGVGINHITLAMSPVDILNKELYAYMDILLVVVIVVITLYTVALVVHQHWPKTAAFFNLLFALFIFILIPLLQQFMLSLPDDPILSGFMFEVQIGVYLTIIVCGFQIVFSIWFKKWKKKALSTNRHPSTM